MSIIAWNLFYLAVIWFVVPSVLFDGSIWLALVLWLVVLTVAYWIKEASER